jgi:hypothetical protein
MALGHGANIVRDGLVLHLDAANPKSYPGTGTVWTDLSGRGNNGTLVNGVGYDTANNGSMVFDGVNDYVSSVSIPNPNGQLTCEVCLNYNSKGAYHNIFDRSSSTPMLWIRPDNRFELNTGSGLVPAFTYVGQNIIATAIFSSNSSPGLQLYINGILIGQNNNIQSSWSNPSTITLFNRGNSQTFSGKTYYLKFYNRALTPAEIRQNFEATRGRYGI